MDLRMWWCRYAKVYLRVLYKAFSIYQTRRPLGRTILTGGQSINANLSDEATAAALPRTWRHCPSSEKPWILRHFADNRPHSPPLSSQQTVLPAQLLKRRRQATAGAQFAGGFARFSQRQQSTQPRRNGDPQNLLVKNLSNWPRIIIASHRRGSTHMHHYWLYIEGYYGDGNDAEGIALLEQAGQLGSAESLLYWATSSAPDST